MLLSDSILAIAIVDDILWYAAMAAVSALIGLALRPKIKVKTAGKDDFAFPTAEEGRLVPVLFGTRRIAGPNVLWAGAFEKKLRRKRSLFGTNVIGAKYYFGLHFGICQANIDGIKQIWVGDRCVWPMTETTVTLPPLLALLAGEATQTHYREDARNLGADGLTSASIYAENIFGGANKEGGILGPVALCYGADDQAVDSYLAAKLGTAVPAFRGLTCAIAKRVYIGTTPYPKPWSFTCKRISKLSDGSAQWYGARAPVGDIFTTGAAVLLTWWQSTYEQTINDQGRMGLRFLERDGTEISTSFADLLDPGAGVWTQRSVSTTIPAGTYVIRVVIEMHRRTGANLDCYIDDIALTVGGVAQTLNSPGAETETGWTTTTGALTRTTGPAGWPAPHGGSYYYWGGENPDTVAYQDVHPSELDLNPAHIIRELLTSTLIGLGKSTGEIDATTFEAAADRLHAEGMGLSMVLDRVAPEGIADTITEILEITDGVLYQDMSAGTWKYELARDDYDPETLDVYDESDIIAIEDFGRPSFGEIPSQVAVHWWDRFRNVERIAYDDDLTILEKQGGNPVVKDLQYYGICREPMANMVAARKMRQASSMLAALRIVGNRAMAGLHPNSVFKFSYAPLDITEMIVRVLTVNHGSLDAGQVVLECVEDIYGAAYTTYGESSEPAADPVSPLVVLDYRVDPVTGAISGTGEVYYDGTAYEAASLPSTTDPVIWWDASDQQFHSGSADPETPETFVILENDAGDVTEHYGAEDELQITDNWRMTADEDDHLLLQHYDAAADTWIDQADFTPDAVPSVKFWNVEMEGAAVFSSVVNAGNSGAALTIDWTGGNNQLVTLTDNCTFTFTPPPGAAGLVLIVKQDATGNRTPTLPANVKTVGSTALPWSTGANAVDILTLRYDADASTPTYWAAVIPNFGAPA